MHHLGYHDDKIAYFSVRWKTENFGGDPPLVPRLFLWKIYMHSAWTSGARPEAFYCRHINFNTVFQSASEHAISIQKIYRIPPPASTPLRRLDPRAFGAQPLPSKILNTPLTASNQELQPISRVEM